MPPYLHSLIQSGIVSQVLVLQSAMSSLTISSCLKHDGTILHCHQVPSTPPDVLFHFTYVHLLRPQDLFILSISSLAQTSSCFTYRKIPLAVLKRLPSEEAYERYSMPHRDGRDQIQKLRAGLLFGPILEELSVMLSRKKMTLLESVNLRTVKVCITTFSVRVLNMNVYPIQT